jgi:hypothetical protein
VNSLVSLESRGCQDAFVGGRLSLLSALESRVGSGSLEPRIIACYYVVGGLGSRLSASVSVPPAGV